MCYWSLTKFRLPHGASSQGNGYSERRIRYLEKLGVSRLFHKLYVHDAEYFSRLIRPGYPACPDHTEKRPLFALLSAEFNAGIELTESFAMLPTAAVSGFYFAHPEAKYFGIGKIGKDQVDDYARRKGMTIEDTERWLAPNLDYDRN